jgi:hypothetical protein
MARSGAGVPFPIIKFKRNAIGITGDFLILPVCNRTCLPEGKVQ